MDPINPHDTALWTQDRWHVIRGSAAETLAASRKAERRYWVASVLVGAAIGVFAVTRLGSVGLLSGEGMFLVLLAAASAPLLGAVLIASSRQGMEPRDPRGAIPGAVLSSRAARHLTPETRDRLAQAHDQGVLGDALGVIERDTQQRDVHVAREIMAGDGHG